MRRVIIVGGGAAGLIAAIYAAQNGHRVTLLEHNEKLGKKLYITGKGRCNITNAGGREAFFAHVLRNPRFLYSAYNACSDEDICELMRRLNVPIKVERGARVYPVSEKASDVIRALSGEAQRLGVETRLHAGVRGITVKGNAVTGVRLTEGTLEADSIVLCTGGMSYPSTGSTGDGYAFAAALGHTIVSPEPSLVPLETAENWPKELSGLALKNVTLYAYEKGNCVYEELGEMLFAHFGVTGPLVLSASAYLNERAGALLKIDLKPGLTYEQLDRRLIRDLDAAQRMTVKNAFLNLLPHRLLPVVFASAGINPDAKAAEFSKTQRQALVKALKELTLHSTGTRPFSEAVVTRGGVHVKEVNAKTMESKLANGLYFAGEILDVDALTGGFNLQIAWSTGALAGLSC